VRSGAQDDVPAAEAGELGDPQPGLDREEQQRVVPPAEEARPVRGDEDRLDLVVGEEGDDRALEALRWDGQDPPDQRGVLGMAARREPEQRVDRRQARVAGAHAVAPVALEVIEEPPDRRSAEILEPEIGRGLAGLLLDEAEQEADRVAVGGDGVGARPALGDEPLGEERPGWGPARS